MIDKTFVSRLLYEHNNIVLPTILFYGLYVSIELNIMTNLRDYHFYQILKMYFFYNVDYLGRIQGGGPGVQGPPLVPREGVLDPSSKIKKTAFIIFNW